MTNTKNPLRIGLIGAGGRGVGGYIRYFAEAPDSVEVVAIADPSETNVKVCLKALEFQSLHPTIYSDWKMMLDAESDLDGMIIATPNFLHHAPAMASLDKGIRVLSLEKPLATTPDDCREIVRKADELGVSIQLGFTYRLSPFFAKVKALLTTGAVGNVVTIQMDELVTPRTTSVLFRGPWRRFTALSGGSLLEKSCHDLDLLTWMADSRPTRVSSFGGKAIFRPNSFLPDKCDEKCPISDRCVYYVGSDAMKGSAGKIDECCIYNSLKDIADHQSVQIQYENGVVCNFMLTFNTDEVRAGKNLHIIGTRGRIWGNAHDKHVMSHNLETGEVAEHHLTLNKSPHAGGNRLHAEEFLRLAAGIAKKPKASEYDAFVSAMLCFAADRSRAETRQVGFHYPGFKDIELV